MTSKINAKMEMSTMNQNVCVAKYKKSKCENIAYESKYIQRKILTNGNVYRRK